MNVALVGFYGLLTALATGLGAAPFAFLRHLGGRAVALANAGAGGLMLGACFGLVEAGSGHGAWQTVAGGVAGVVFLLATQRLLAGHEVRIAGLSGADARRIVLFVAVMTVHSFAEGVAVGAAFGGGPTLAAVITVAIAVHNIPEGLAVSAVLRPRGASLLACAGWSVFSSLPQPLMAVPAYLFVDRVQPALPYGMGFAAGAMIFMVVGELLPEAYEEAPRPLVALVGSLTLIAMVLFQRSL